MKRSIVILLLLTGCAAPFPNLDFIEQESKYDSLFERDTHYISIAFDIPFVNPPGIDPSVTIWAYCNTGNETIHVNQTTWVTLDDITKMLIIFHELGHCDLHRAHRTDMLPDGCPASIMYPTGVSDDCFKAHKADYYKELISAQ